MISVGSVIQVRENVPAWGGCLMIVEEVKEWGVQVSMRLPGKGMQLTYLRLKHGEFYYVGMAALTFEGKEELKID